MDPQQELFSALLLELKKQYPDSVYDTFLPPEGTPYPFIYLADSDFVSIPVRGLTDPNYLAARSKLISSTTTMPKAHPGTPPGVTVS